MNWYFWCWKIFGSIACWYKKKPGQYWPGYFVWPPRSSTQQTTSATELIPCFYIYNNKKKNLVKGQKPTSFPPPNKAITQKFWKRSLRQEQKLSNPVRIGFKFIEYLKDHPDATSDNLAEFSGFSKARVCQMIALCRKLPSEITDFLLNKGGGRNSETFHRKKAQAIDSDGDKWRQDQKNCWDERGIIKWRLFANFPWFLTINQTYCFHI